MLFLASLFLFFLQMPSAYAEAPYCVARPADKNTVVNPQLLTAPLDLNRLYKSTSEELNKLNKTVIQLKDQSVLPTPLVAKQTLTQQLAQAHIDFANAKKDVVETVISIDSSHRLAAERMIEGYFKLGSLILSLDLLNNPYGSTIESIRNTYALVFTNSQLEEVFPQNLAMIDGIVQRPLPATAASEMSYQVIWSDHNLYSFFVRAAALSATTRNSGKAYLETVRCQLGNLMMNKLVVNETIIGQENQPLPIDANQNLCLNNPAHEFYEMALHDSQSDKEQILRESVSEHWPTEPKDDALTSLLNASSGLFSPLQLLLEPKRVVQILINTGNTQANLDAMIDVISQRLAQYTALQYQNVLNLDPLESLWGDKRLQKIFFDSLNSCHYAITDTFSQTLDNDKIIAMLNNADQLNFIFQLLGGLLTDRADLMTMNETQLKIFFRDFIKNERRTATLLSMQYFYEHDHDSGIDTADLMAAVRKVALPIINEDIDKLWDQNHLEDYAGLLAKTVLAKREGAKSSSTELIQFATSMIEGAKKVQSYLDEKITSPAQLDYDDSALIRTFTPKINTLSAGTRQFVDILTSEKSFAGRKKIWAEFEKNLQAQAKAAGVSCRAINFGDRLAYDAKDLVASVTPKTLRPDQETTQRDCDTVMVFAGAIGLNDAAPPTKFSSVYVYLEQTLKKSDLEVFVKNYREELAAPVLDALRPLSFRVSAPPQGPLSKIYNAVTSIYSENAEPETYAQVLSRVNKLEEALPLVREALRRTSKNSQMILAKVVNAKEEKDLGWLVTETNIINAFLGEFNLQDYFKQMNGFRMVPGAPDMEFDAEPISEMVESSYFIFPNLLDYHQRLQKLWTRDEFNSQDIADSIVSLHGRFGTGVAALLLFKGGYSFMPSWRYLGRAPIISFLEQRFDVAGPGLSAWGDYMLALLIGHAHKTFNSKLDFRTELGHIDDLLHVDALGVGSTDNPLPLVEWADYSKLFHLYTSHIAEANSSIKQDAFWSLFPVTQGLFMRAAGRVGSTARMRSNVKVESMTYSQRMAFEEGLRRTGARQIARMRYYLSDLRNPTSLDLSELRLNLDTIRNHPISKTEAGRIREVQLAETAYRKVIKEIGNEVHNLKDHPTLMDAYSKALFGEAGNAQQLEDIYTEWVRLFQHGEDI
jgi:hypothetical protein